jgi:hypothetical protein
MDNSSIEFFYKHVIDTSSDSDSDDGTEILMVAATLIHEHNERQMPRFGGSTRPHMSNLKRDQEGGHVQLYKDYFHPTDPLYPEHIFRHHFWMSRNLFLTILNAMRDHDPYFECKPDTAGKIGFSSYQKCCAAIRMLAYGVDSDLVNEYMRLSETTCLESMYKFCRAVVAVFGKVYLREPNAADTARLLSINESRGFPRMLGSIEACIGSGRPILLLGRGNIAGMWMGA